MSNILHILDHSLPEHDGYSFRSHSILTNLIRTGLNVDVITGPKQGPTEQVSEEIDAVRYRRTPISDGESTAGVSGQIRVIGLTRARIREHLRQRSADVIHAHSPCLNGLAAIGLGIPLLYEMRSSWEDASVSVGATHEGSIRYRISRMLETYVAKKADAVVVICEGLKEELVSRGIRSGKITVVPNALPEEMFSKPDEKAVAAIRDRYVLGGSKVIGFFGSFFEWEGVDCLLRAMPALLAKEPTAKLLIAGGGRQEAFLHKLASDLDLSDSVIFAGRVSHDEIGACYAAADVMAYPRLPDRLTNMVTPLKPLEAMAIGTAVVASDVGGHKELVDNGETGILFAAGSHDDLASKILGVLGDPDGCVKMIATAAEAVRKERRWSVVADLYTPIYEKLISENKR